MDKKILIVSRIIIIGSLCGLIKVVSNHIKSLDNTCEQLLEMNQKQLEEKAQLRKEMNEIKERDSFSLDKFFCDKRV